MNKKSLFKILFSVLLIACLLCACSGRKTVIGVSQCCGGLWREKVNKEIRLALYQYKDAEAVFKSAENDGRRQARQIDSLIAQNVDLACSGIMTFVPLALSKRQSAEESISKKKP